jgi:phosphoribosylaminoimidazole-succinocarboxamide synthase
MMTDATQAVRETNLPQLTNRGKVRDLYDLGDQMMIVAADRISAFDVVMNEPIPGKGVLLTQMSEFWLNTLPACQPHHLDYVVADGRVPAGYEDHIDALRGRAMVVKRVDIVPIECIVRGYIIGSGWKDYQATGKVSGIELPAGLQKAEKLPEPIFTPTTKASVGHDEPVDFERAIEIVAEFLRVHSDVKMSGAEVMQQVRQRSLAIYAQATEHAAKCGIILADTKFEFGIRDGEILLADEVLTPDSSRFWPADKYAVGRDQPSFDKQVLRDHLDALSWNKQPPPPPLSPDVIARTRQGYEDAYRRLTA